MPAAWYKFSESFPHGAMDDWKVYAIRLGAAFNNIPGLSAQVVDNMVYLTFNNDPAHKIRFRIYSNINRQRLEIIMLDNAGVNTMSISEIYVVSGVPQNVTANIHISPTCFFVLMGDAVNGRSRFGQLINIQATNKYWFHDNIFVKATDETLNSVSVNYGLVDEAGNYVLIPTKYKTPGNKLVADYLNVYGVHNTFCDNYSFITMSDGTKAVFYDDVFI